MCSTPCQECSFFDKNKKTCKAFNHVNDNLTAPGFCRMFSKEEISVIEAIDKSSLKTFDLLLIYNDDIQTIEDIKSTLDFLEIDKSKINNLIICSSNRVVEKDQELLDFLKETLKKNIFKNIRITFMIDKGLTTEEIIHEGISTHARSDYVLVLEAGDDILLFHNVVDKINGESGYRSNSVFWQLPIRYGVKFTLFHAKNSPYGIYIRSAYKNLGGTHKDGEGKVHTFINKLSNIEHQFGINLLWFTDSGYIDKNETR